MNLWITQLPTQGKAEEKGERWWLSINYDRIAKKVEFVFIDYGVGIFTSLSKKTTRHKIKTIFEKAKTTFGVDAAGSHLKAIVTQSARKTHKLPKGAGKVYMEYIKPSKR